MSSDWFENLPDTGYGLERIEGGLFEFIRIGNTVGKVSSV